MGKVIATVGVVVGAVALAATGIGAIAAPALAGSVSIFGVSASTLLLAGTALQAVGQALIKRPETSPTTTDRLNASLVTDTPRKIALGRTALNTDLRYQEWWGRDQEYCSQVFVVASHWCESIDEVWLDDKLAWSATGGVTQSFVGYLGVQTHAQAGPGSAFYAGWSGRWGTNAVFAGCATLYLQFKVTGNGKKATSPFASSITSRVTVVGRGARLPDPRFDSTAGGSGAVRVADQSTWSWAPQGHESGRNPALALLFYLLGWRIQNPQTGAWTLAVGRGIPVDRIDLDSFITAANLCDEPVMRADGTTEPRYRCDGTFSESDDPPQVIAAFETCMNAKLRDSTGRFSLQVLHNDLATPVVDFGDDDVLGDFTWTAGNNLNDRKNVVRGRYVNDTALYQLTDFPAVRLPSLDGIDRIDSVDLALVQSATQAQRIAKQRLQRMQYPGAFGAEFNARGWAVKDGDVVRLTFSALGFDRKLFRVAEGLIDPTGVVPLVLIEEHESIYAWDRDDRAAVLAAEPNTFDPLLLPIVQAIDDAGKTAEWPAITGEGKPDDYATVGAPIGTTVGDLPVDEVIATLARVEPIALDTADLQAARARLDEAVADLTSRADGTQAVVAALDASVIDGATTQRQLDDALGRLGEATLRLITISDRTQQILRDAGVIVDPNDGTVRIYAVDQLNARQNSTELTLDAQRAEIALRATSNEVDEKILKAVLDPSQVAQLEPLIARVALVEQVQDALRAEISTKANLAELTAALVRVTDVEQVASAAAGAVSTKVSQDAFDGAMLRLGAAEQKLLSYGDISSYSIELRQVRAAVTGTTGDLLSGIVDAHDDRNRTIEAQAGLRQELYSKITGVGDDLAVEVRSRLTLEAALGALDARSVQDRLLLVQTDKVLAQDIDGLQVASAGQEAQIATLQQASLDAQGGIAGVATSIRQQVRGASQSDASVLAGLLNDHEAQQRTNNSLAEVQTQLTTTLVAGFAASAAARQALRAQIDAADARFTAEQTVTADRFNAVTQVVEALGATLNDPASGLAITRADLNSLRTTTAAAQQATAESIAQLRAIVTDPASGLAKTRAELLAFQQAQAQQDAATVQRFEQLEAVVNDPATGLAKTRADVASVSKAVSDLESATAEDIRQVSATFTATANQVAQTAEQNRAATEGRLQSGLDDNDKAIVAVGEALDGESAARDAGDKANQEQIGAVDGRVTQLATAMADGDHANAELIQQVTARLNGNGVTVEQKIAALVEATGKITGTSTIAIDTNGNMVGTQLVGSSEGRGSLNLINADLRMGTGRIIFNNGNFMRVQGTGFGVGAEFISWFGPTMAITECSRTNAISYETITGAAYWGGTIAAGALKNAAQTTSIEANASVSTGQFASNGKARTVVVSYSWVHRRSLTGTGSAAGSPSARIDISRVTDNRPLGSLNVTGQVEVYPANGADPGYIYEVMAGSLTITDTDGGTAAEYRAAIATRTVATFSGNQAGPDTILQVVGIVSTEQ